jgi:hypothetical protein
MHVSRVHAGRLFSRVNPSPSIHRSSLVTADGNAPLLPWARNSHLSTAGAGRPGPRVVVVFLGFSFGSCAMHATHTYSAEHTHLLPGLLRHFYLLPATTSPSTPLHLNNPPLSLHSFLVGVEALGSPTHSMPRHTGES